MATSKPVHVNPGPAKTLGFSAVPDGGPGGLAFAIQPVVGIPNAGGALVATGTGAITLSITFGTGTAGAILYCPGGLDPVRRVDAGGGHVHQAEVGGDQDRFRRNVRDRLPVRWRERHGQLQESMDGKTWVLVSPVTAGPDGTGTFTYLVETTRWFRVTNCGDPGLLAGASKPVKLVVLYSITLRPTNKGLVKTIARNKVIAFSATLKPTLKSSPKTLVTFEIYKLVGKSTWAFGVPAGRGNKWRGRGAPEVEIREDRHLGVRARAAGTIQNGTSPWTTRETYRVK